MGLALGFTLGFGVAAPAAAQTGAPAPGAAGQAAEAYLLLQQKASMLRVYLDSDRVTRLRGGGDPISARIDEARADLDAGVAALASDRLEEAGARLDAGLRLVSEVVAQSGAARREVDPDAASATYRLRRRQIDSFLAAVGRGGEADAAAPWRARLAALEASVAKADTRFEQGQVEAAGRDLAAAYREVVAIVGEARQGQSVTYRLVFESAAEEYAYELERNRSYEMLVTIAIAEQVKPDRDMQPYIDSLVAQSRSLRRRAETEALRDEFPAAIATLEEASTHLVRALRSAGVWVPE